MFDAYGATKSESNDKPTVDFDAINKYTVETAALQERETLVGYVAQIVDLGTQELPDAEDVFKGDEKEEAEIITKYPNTYFKDGFDRETKQTVRLKCYPQKPQQCVAIAIDFPEVIVDKGQFFGESKPLPLRLWMGNQFYIENVGMVVGRPTPLKVVNLDKTRNTKIWSMAQNSLLYKMAVASKLIKAGEPFLPQRIDELLGKAFQFEAQVHFKESKGKQYYTEYVKFVGALGRGQSEPEHLTTPYLIQFNKMNDENAVRDLRNHVVNTIKRASNFEGSIIKGQLEKLGKGAQKASEGQEEAVQEKAEEAKPTPKPKGKPVPPPIDEGDDIPF